jgi:hypothetical protein
MCGAAAAPSALHAASAICILIWHFAFGIWHFVIPPGEAIVLTLPTQLLLRQRLESHPLEDPVAAVRAALERIGGDEWAGRSVAIGLGSRGIDQGLAVTRAAVAWLRERGAQPFAFPAMGSHGGATPEGQREVLESYGITEASIGAPIRAEMETHVIGETALGAPVHGSQVALAADAVLLINRVKPHTDFDSAVVGSGIRKMSVIGFGKARGAASFHLASSRAGYEAMLLEMSRIIAERVPRLYGLALIEDGTHRLAHVEVVRGAELAAREPGLYEQARAWMPALPFAEVDVLVIDEIGKDVSGAGMDPNIIGRGVHGGAMRSCRSRVRSIYARRLTPASHGNAIGLGLADVVHGQLVGAMDATAVYTNALSSMTPVTARIPINFSTDQACMAAALRIAGADAATARILRIRNTVSLEYVVASEGFADEIASASHVEVVRSATPWRFRGDGQFDAETDLLAPAAVA